MADCGHLVCQLGTQCLVECEDPVSIDGDELLKQVKVRRAKISLAYFVQAAWHVLHPGQSIKWAPHLQAICDHVQAIILDLIAVRNGEKETMSVQNLLINIPPRSGKTVIIGVMAPVWAWLHDPTLKIRYVTGNEKVRKETSRFSRDLVESDWFINTFQPDWAIRADQDAIESWANTARGERAFNTFQSRITGQGGDMIIIDDPHDAGEVHSELKRSNVINRWRDAIDNRVNDRRASARIGVMQRLREDDWSDHVLKQGWAHLRIPMEYEKRVGCDCRDCKAGQTFLGWKDWRDTEAQPMHPERFSTSELAVERARLLEYGYAGQMQQRPAPAEGAMFLRDWFKDCDLNALPKFDDMIVSCDLANSDSDNKTNSNNALLVVGRKGPWRYVLDAEVGRWSFLEIKQRIASLQTKWTPANGRLVKILVEKKAAGNFAISALKQEMGLQGVIENDEAQKAHNDYIVRAMAVQPQVEGGNVMVAKGAPWRDSFLHELTTFPLGSKDDQVDALTMALNYFRDSSDVMRARMLCSWQ